jgi:lipid A 3-O-deacylase
MSKKAYMVLLLLAATFALGQGRTREIGLITENDLYTSSKNDKYYTNGLELFYRFLAKNGTVKVNKKIVEFRIGQFIYNPQFINKGAMSVIDRPFAGYLFGTVEKSFFFKMNRFLKVGLNWVFLGPTLLEKKLKKDSISFSVIKKFMAGKPK